MTEQINLNQLAINEYQLDFYRNPLANEIVVDVVLRRVHDANGPDRWAIRGNRGDELDKDGQWVYARSGSSQDDYDLSRVRWASAQDAIDFWNEVPREVTRFDRVRRALQGCAVCGQKATSFGNQKGLTFCPHCDQPLDVASRVIFLDFDGVLTDSSTFELSSERVVRLNCIWVETGAGLVFSTSHRETHSTEELTAQLLEAGLHSNVPILGATPVIKAQTQSGLQVGVSRWREIVAWLDDNPQVASYAILDDNVFSDFPIENTVECDGLVGLTDENARRAIEILLRER